MDERLYRAVSNRAVVGYVCADRPDRDPPGEVIACAPYVRKLILGLGEELAEAVLRRRGFGVERVFPS
jgi:hypothetical protein